MTEPKITTIEWNVVMALQSTLRVPTCDELRLPSDHSGGGENHPLARSKATTRLRWRCSRS